MELSSGYSINSYFHYRLSEGENIDAYLGKPVNPVSREDIISGKLNNSIIFTKKKRIDNDAQLKQYLENKPLREVGDMYVISILGN